MDIETAEEKRPRELYIEFDERPVSWKRARRQGKAYYDSQLPQKNLFRGLLLQQFTGLQPFTESVHLELEFVFSMPKSWSLKKKKLQNGKWHVSTVDIDNLIKFMLDTFNVILWYDDRIISTVKASKRWGETDKVTMKAQEEK